MTYRHEWPSRRPEFNLILFLFLSRILGNPVLHDVSEMCVRYNPVAECASFRHVKRYIITISDNQLLCAASVHNKQCNSTF